MSLRRRLRSRLSGRRGHRIETCATAGRRTGVRVLNAGRTAIVLDHQPIFTPVQYLPSDTHHASSSRSGAHVRPVRRVQCAGVERKRTGHTGGRGRSSTTCVSDQSREAYLTFEISCAICACLCELHDRIWLRGVCLMRSRRTCQDANSARAERRCALSHLRGDVRHVMFAGL